MNVCRCRTGWEEMFVDVEEDRGKCSQTSIRFGVHVRRGRTGSG